MAITITQDPSPQVRANGSSVIRKITFTSTAAASETVTTAFNIVGKLLRYTATGGDAAWDFTLGDGEADIFNVTAINVALPQSGLIVQVGTKSELNIAMSGPLTITTANNSTTAAVITIYYEAL